MVAAAQAHPHFSQSSAFANALKTRAREYFEHARMPERGSWRMFAKSAVIFTWLFSSYALFYAATHLWQVVLIALSFGLAMGAVGFDVQHDGGHGAFSDSRWANLLAAHSLDLIGGSSYVWHWKHNVTHHTYANIAHVDGDTDVGPFARLTPHHRWRAPHRLQHLYIWVLYAMLPFKWIYFDDFRDLATGRIGTQPFPAPRGGRMVALIGMKLVYLVWAVVIPFWLRPWQGVVVAYCVSAVTLGIVLAIVFQLAHCVGEADFPSAESIQIAPIDWATHQVNTTVDFARENKLLTWYLGGLNFQIEHHLFPRVSHVHFPALSKMVEATCAEFGVPYRVFPSFRVAVGSHMRWLRRMGARPAIAAV